MYKTIKEILNIITPYDTISYHSINSKSFTLNNHNFTLPLKEKSINHALNKIIKIKKKEIN